MSQKSETLKNVFLRRYDLTNVFIRFLDHTNIKGKDTTCHMKLVINNCVPDDLKEADLGIGGNYVDGKKFTDSVIGYVLNSMKNMFIPFEVPYGQRFFHGLYDITVKLDYYRHIVFLQHLTENNVISISIILVDNNNKRNIDMFIKMFKPFCKEFYSRFFHRIRKRDFKLCYPLEYSALQDLYKFSLVSRNPELYEKTTETIVGPSTTSLTEIYLQQQYGPLLQRLFTVEERKEILSSKGKEFKSEFSRILRAVYEKYILGYDILTDPDSYFFYSDGDVNFKYFG